MFGSAKRLRSRLETEGVRAPAVVVAAQPTTTTHGPPNGSIIDRKWKLTIEVQPGGQAAFDADVSEYFPPGSPPNEGSTMSVLFDPKDHTQVCVEVGSVVSAAPSISAEQSADAAAMASELSGWSRGNRPSMLKQLRTAGQLRSFQLTEAREGRDGKMFVQSAGTTVSAQAEAPTDPEQALSQLEDLKARGELTDRQLKIAKRFLGR